VKNTFIDDINERCVPQASFVTMSCPLRAFRRPCEKLEIDDFSQALLKCSDIPDNVSEDSTDVSSSSATLETLSDSNSLESPPASPGRAHALNVLEDMDKFELQAAKAGVDISLLPSRGSVFHDAGTCKPCAWFHKSSGCGNGWGCKHCHACPEGALKEKKKARVRAYKTQGAKRYGGSTYDGEWCSR